MKNQKKEEKGLGSIIIYVYYLLMYTQGGNMICKFQFL